MKVMRNGKQFTQGANYEYNEKRAEVVNAGHDNAAINEIHSTPNMTREEKLAAGRAILAAAKEEPAAEAATGKETTTAAPATDTNSKVCTIANRLSRQGMNRSEAFRKAWATVKAETVETKVAGVTYGNRQTALEHLTKYDSNLISVNLERETGNEYDNNAVKVITTVQGKGSYTIGYLPRLLAAIIAPLIDAGKAVKATFKEIRGHYHNYHNYGMAVSVSI